jgi:hypothetical protein
MGEIATLVSGIEYKVRKLLARNQSLRDDNERLNKEAAELKTTISRQAELLKKAEERVNLIKLAKSLETKEGTVEAKLKINELVREIDKCIGLLNT